MKHTIFKNQGFTLVELLIAGVLFVSIVAGVAALILYYLKSFSFSFEEQQSISQAQYAISTMLRELREARSGENGAWPMAQTDDATVVFYSDVTNDGRTDRVRYFLSGTDLQKGIIEPSLAPVSYPVANEVIQTIATSIDLGGKAMFTYYNGNYPTDITNNPLTPANRVLNTRFVGIYVRVNIQADYAAAPYELNSGVQIRSLKDNL